jgi:NAD(P)-dependent dehydrogenase (short-subunit alcohol dehydrogenase family)
VPDGQRVAAPTAGSAVPQRRHHGKTAVVTGGTVGIGRAFAVKLASEGASVAILARSPGDDVLAEIEDAGGKAVAISVDLTDRDAVLAARREVVAQVGPAHILINNAGIYPNIPFEHMTFANWRALFSVNVDAMFHTTQAFLPDMRAAGWGRIVNMTSNAINLVIPGFSCYVATKMAVIGFTRGAATEFAEAGITVNAIAPSLVRTATTEAGPPLFLEAVPQMQAIKRLEEPADLVGAMSFLVSDDASFITGQTLAVDGGLVRL